MSSLATLLAISWQPEIRGVTVVVIGAVVLMGSVYLILTTNLGSRLGFLVSLAALSSWLMLMGIFWLVYGIGLKGQDPSWVGKEVIGTELSNSAFPVAQVEDISHGDADGAGRRLDPHPARTTRPSARRWRRPTTSSRTRPRPSRPGDYKPIAVYSKGGERYPKIGNSLDFFAFLHRPHYAIVEVQPVIPTLTEAGRAPLPAVVDPSKPPTYVLMERDLGTHRQPAVSLTIGAGLLFALCCYTLHRRERSLRTNLAEAASGGAVVPVGAAD